MEHFQNSNASHNYNNISTKTIIHFCLSREESVSQSLYVTTRYHKITQTVLLYIKRLLHSIKVSSQTCGAVIDD